MRGHQTPRLISVTSRKPIVPKLLSNERPETREAVLGLGKDNTGKQTLLRHRRLMHQSMLSTGVGGPGIPGGFNILLTSFDKFPIPGTTRFVKLVIHNIYCLLSSGGNHFVSKTLLTGKGILSNPLGKRVGRRGGGGVHFYFFMFTQLYAKLNRNE